MASRRKRVKFKEWISGFFLPNDEICYTPDGPQRPSHSAKNIQNVEVNNAVYVSGTGNIVLRQDGQGDRHMMVTHVMSLLSRHIIRGAAHDDSARDPPPRCHPDTRVKLIARITAWLDGQAQEELLLWITGPAGVGKSAVVQTCAEHLVKYNLLGASVFISRPNGRNNPHRIFVTIAYQLAVRIEAYRKFIVERLSLDPELLNRGMTTQFRKFIIEPFVEEKIGVGGKRWGILLDGLDELEGEDAQCTIIQLISDFAHEHRDSPLVWIIASRPEPHISNMFDDDEARRSYWSEYIPIDSTEACDDVERFLRSSFVTMRKKFRYSLPGDWPSDAEFLKLTVAASGLFIYAEVVMQFIRDPENADPVSQFEIVLSVIGRLDVVPTKDNPFVQLDAIYREILSLIPPKMWPRTKRLLGFSIHQGMLSFHGAERFTTLKGNSVLFGLSRHVVYACLIKCHSMVRVPNWKVAHKEKLTILHASFADYLKDSSRSGDFHIGNEDVKEDILCSLLEVWNKCSGDNIVTVESTWLQHCLKLDDKTPSRVVTKFHAKLFYDVVSCLQKWLWVLLGLQAKSPQVYAQLRQVHMIKLCYYFDVYDLREFVNTLVDLASDVDDIELLRQVQLKDLKFGHLDWKEMSPARSHYGRRSKFSTTSDWISQRPRSSNESETFISELESIQERSPEVKVVIFGGVCEGRIAAFRHSLNDKPQYRDFTAYIIPYPE